MGGQSGRLARAETCRDQPNSPSPRLPFVHGDAGGLQQYYYSPEELSAFAERGGLVDRLNEFEPRNDWSGPTVRALSDTLAKAVFSRPRIFLDILKSFLKAKPAYQYAVLEGLKRSWGRQADEHAQPDWDVAWPLIISFLAKLLLDEAYWQSDAPSATDLRHPDPRMDQRAGCRLSPRGHATR